MSCCVSETAKASPRASFPSASLDTESKNHNARQKDYTRTTGLLARLLQQERSERQLLHQTASP